MGFCWKSFVLTDPEEEFYFVGHYIFQIQENWVDEGKSSPFLAERILYADLTVNSPLGICVQTIFSEVLFSRSAIVLGIEKDKISRFHVFW